MRVSDFDFDLPDERIASKPLTRREEAKLLHVTADGLIDRTIADLAHLLGPSDMLVVNNTKVIPAALSGWRGSRDPNTPDAKVRIDFNLTKEMSDHVWQAFARPAKRLKVGDVLEFDRADLTATIHARVEDGLFELAFNLKGDDLKSAIEKVGQMPLPPYILRQREANEDDVHDYQTVFARHAGAVAAPTAGLHFSQEFLIQLKQIVSIEEVTLHVGAGTFLPVKVDDTDDHKMHSEWGWIAPDSAARIDEHKQAGGSVIAVGTTSLRILESAADPSGRLSAFEGETDIFITPGYRFKIVDALVTNFHLPRSTLFMLVCAFSGLDAMRAAYAYAISRDYRFYSYGDACFLDRRQAV